MRLKRNVGYFPYKDKQIPIFMTPHARSKRLSMRFFPSEEEIRITVPLRHTIKSVLAFIQKNQEWLEHRLSHVPEPCAKTAIPYLGIDHLIHYQDGAHANVHLCEKTQSITVQGPEKYARPFLQGWLVDQAKEKIGKTICHWKEIIGVSVKKVVLKDTKRQWGSCSKDGSISLSWRLILMPPAVAEYICIHELCHRLEMNHSSRFWDHVERFSPHFETHLKWLRKNGANLYWVLKE